MRIFGGSPPSASSHSAGVAISSPSASRPVMSAITVTGSVAVSAIFLPRLAIVPCSTRSRSTRFSSARSAFFRPNSRAISLVPALPGFARMKATMASLPGKPLSRVRFTSSSSARFAGALLGRCLRGSGWFGGRGLGRLRDRRARLAGGLRFRLGDGLLHRRLLRRLRRCFRLGIFRFDFAGLGRLVGRLAGFFCRLCLFHLRLVVLGRLLGLVRLSWLFCFGFLRLRHLAASLIASFGGALVDQRDGFRKGDG